VRLDADGSGARRASRSAPTRIRATQADLDAQFALRTKLRDLLDRDHKAVNRLREARKDPRTSATTKRALDAIEAQLMQPKAKSRQDTLNFGVRLNHRIARSSARSDPPTPFRRGSRSSSRKQLEDELARLEKRLDAAVGGQRRTRKRARAA